MYMSFFCYSSSAEGLGRRYASLLVSSSSDACRGFGDRSNQILLTLQATLHTKLNYNLGIERKDCVPFIFLMIYIFDFNDTILVQYSNTCVKKHYLVIKTITYIK